MTEKPEGKDLEKKISEQSQSLLKAIFTTPYTYYAIAKMAVALGIFYFTNEKDSRAYFAIATYASGSSLPDLLFGYGALIGGKEEIKKNFGNLPFEAAVVKLLFRRNPDNGRK